MQPIRVILADYGLGCFPETVIASQIPFIVSQKGSQVILLPMRLECREYGIVPFQFTKEFRIRVTDAYFRAQAALYRFIKMPPGMFEQVRINIIPDVELFIYAFQDGIPD